MEESKHITDYTKSLKTIEIILGNAKGYATINEVFFGEDGGIEPSGEFFIYLLHPLKGTKKFTMEYDYDYETWMPTELVIKELIEEEVLRQITDALPVKKINEPS